MPTEPLSLTPTLDVLRQAHPDRPEERCSLSTVHPLPPPAPPAVVGEGASPPRSRVAGERNPVAVATVSKRTGGRSRPAPAPSLTFPSFLPSGVGWGRGCPLSRSGSGWRYQVRVLSHPQGGSSARRLSSARALFPPGPQPSRYSRAQASSSNCLPASGQAAQRTEPKLGAGSGPGGSRQWQRKPLRALGWRRGARARARAEPGVRARAANRGIPHPLPHAAEAAAREGVGGTPDPPAAPRRGRGCGLAIPRASQHRKSTLLTAPRQQATQRGWGRRPHWQLCGHRRRMLSGAAEVTNLETHTAQPGHVQTQVMGAGT